MENQKKNKTALHRLLGLPEIFSVKNFCKLMQMDSHQASVYLSRWKKDGFIHEMGPRSRVYLNLIKNPNIEDNLFKAVTKIYPEFIFGGTAILRDSDWITQISRQTEILVWKKNSVIQLNNFDIMPRTQSWFIKYKDGIVDREDGYRQLLPEYALVDLCESKEWVPDPDDLFLNDDEKIKIKSTFEKLNVSIPDNLKQYFDVTNIIKNKTFKL